MIWHQRWLRNVKDCDWKIAVGAIAYGIFMLAIHQGWLPVPDSNALHAGAFSIFP